jgi:hypothetical protein
MGSSSRHVVSALSAVVLVASLLGPGRAGAQAGRIDAITDPSQCIKGAQILNFED